MKSTLILISAFLVFCQIHCSTIESKRDIIITEKDLIPEGTAIDSRTGIIYIGSTYKRKIIQINPQGEITDFIPQQLDNIWSIVGMEVDEERDKLWANTAHANEVMPLINPDTLQDWVTNVTSFDIHSKKKVKKYPIEGNGFLNDLTVLPNGDVYITETINNKVYKIDAQKDSLELFIKPEGYTFLNGVTYAQPYQSLYVSSSEGVLKINVETGKFQLVTTPESIDLKTIDGLSFYKNTLIGHQSTKVSQFYLSNDGNAVTKVEILDAGPDYDGTTTGEIIDNDYYFIVNSQLRSGRDPVKKMLKPIDSLEQVIIRKIKLK